MKKRFLGVPMAGMLGAWALMGCRKAPEASVDQDVYHAKSALEREVETIAAQEDEQDTAAAGEAEPGRTCDILAGTKENGIRICAEVPAVPRTLPVLTLREREDLDAEKLKKLLDSENGQVKDLTEAYLAQREKELREMDEEDKPGRQPNFGDDSFLLLSDGEKEASFARNTCADYEDKKLKKNCDKIYKKAPEIDAAKDGGAAGAEFSPARAKEILLEKLAVLDLAEPAVSRIFYYELGKTAFYELAFTPSYEHTAVASEFGGVRFGEVHPGGTAWITPEGTAVLRLEDYCGKITEQSETGEIMTFQQVADVLEKYLENNTVCGSPQAELTQAELVYYPALRETELILTPAWHIYIPLQEMEELLESGDPAWEKAAAKGAAWNIYLDAVTGKLLKVE